MSSFHSEIVQRLLFHAGIPRQTQGCDDLSEFLFDLSRSEFSEFNISRLKIHLVDIVNLIQSLAALASTERCALSPDNRMIAETTVYAVNEITRTLLAHSVESRIKVSNKEIESALVESAFAITVAWSEFLVADVENLHDQIRIEFLTRGISDQFDWNG
ncbi:MAG: hypothetical protein NT013_10060 [Planctomycetia bacterium]|nr:hypothetical protein [Planctomycetia bacterium]